MLNNFLNKNLSTKEHIALIDNKYANSEKISVDGILCLKKENYLLIPNPEKNGVSAFFFKKLIKDGFITYGLPEILEFNDKFITNTLTGKTVYLKTGLTGKMNTSLLYVNFLNLKTINHFSTINISKRVVFTLKRKDWCVGFSMI